MTLGNTEPIRALIVDDEALGRDVVRHMLQTHPDVTIVGEASNGQRALEEVRAKQPDVLFLDIHMPRMSGLEMLEELAASSPPVIVFTTAHDEHAVEAFTRCALDYLLKPFDQERFDTAMRRVREQLQNARDADIGRRLRDLLATGAAGGTHPANGRTRFVVKDQGRVSFVAVDSVDWLEASGNYVGLHVGAKNHLIHQTLAEVERSLDPAVFLRIHRSTIVNVTRIKELQPYANGEFVVILNNGTRLKLSRSFRERANEVLGLG